jgi:ATP-dependent HslUV protease ATP-binding subunit HslU
MLNCFRRCFSNDSFNLNPKQLLKELDKYIIGQHEAKKAISVALRARWRRKNLPEEIRKEITPKNILMIGPTGSGKTEIARRLANLCGAPFIKVEATLFTEVGYHGKDVEEIIKELVVAGIHQAKENTKNQIKNHSAEISSIVGNYILMHVLGPNYPENERKASKLQDIISGKMDTRIIHFEQPDIEKFVYNNSKNQDIQIEEFFEIVKTIAPGKSLYSYTERLAIGEAKKLLTSSIIDVYIRGRNNTKEALEAVQENGIVFIDEIDKIATPPDQIKYGSNPSAEGVQRDLLPLIEGTTVSTKQGDVKTDHILFIASGSFSEARPSDLLPELQGRLPVRVNLNSLSKKEFKTILLESQNSIIKQNIALMKTEGIELEFTEDAIDKIAEVADEVNKNMDNTGARRLITVVEKILEDLSFNAPDVETKFLVTREFVESKTKEMLKKTDLKKYLV